MVCIVPYFHQGTKKQELALSRNEHLISYSVSIKMKDETMARHYRYNFSRVYLEYYNGLPYLVAQQI